MSKVALLTGISGFDYTTSIEAPDVENYLTAFIFFKFDDVIYEQPLNI